LSEADKAARQMRQSIVEESYTGLKQHLNELMMVNYLYIIKWQQTSVV